MAEAKKNIKGTIASLNIYHTDAYAIAVRNGYKGTEAEWLSSIAEDASKIARDESADIYKEATDAVKELYAKCDKAEGDAKAVIAAAANTAVASVESSEGAALTAIAEAKATMLEEIEVAGDIVQTTGCSETSVMSQGASSRSFANAIKGEESGGAVLCEDVSPVLHPAVVGVMSKNLFDIEKRETGTFDENGDLFLPNVVSDFYKFEAKENTQYTLSAYVKNSNTSGNGRFRVLYTDGSEDNAVLLNRETDWAYMSYTTKAGKTVKLIQTYFGDSGSWLIKGGELMINKGTTAEPYIPCVPNGTAVKVTSAGLNLFGGNSTSNPQYIGDYYCDPNGNASTNPGFNCFYIPVNPSQTIFMIGNEVLSSVAIVHFLDKNNNLVSVNASLYNATSGVINVPNGASFLRFAIKKGSIQLCINNSNPAINGKIYPFVSFRTIDTTVGSTIDLPSIAPYMSVYTNTEGTAVDVTYVKDTNAVVQKLVNAIVALGGNV